MTALPSSPVPVWLPLALVALGIVAYANALGNGFVLDDRGIILQHPLVQHPGTVWRAFASPYWPESVGGGQYRPLGLLSFALDWRLAANSPAWFHGVNVLWHGGVVALVFAVARKLLPLAGAIVAAGLFAVHPVHVEAVANVVGRLELMAAAGVLATLLLHARGSWWAPVTLAAALLSKEHAVMTPFLLALFDLTRSPLQAPAARRRKLYGAYAATVALWAVVMLLALRGTSLSTTSAVYADSGLVTRLLTVLSVVPHYARLLVAPWRLSADYEPDVLQPVAGVTASVLLGIVIVLATLIITVRTWRREPVLAACIALVPLTLAPVSNVAMVTGVALAERTLYLPSVGVVLIVGWLMSRPVVPLRTAAIAATLLGAVFSVRTWTRTPVWRDARAFAITLVEEHPESYRGHWVAGRVLGSSGDTQAAARELGIARRIYGRDVQLLRESANVIATLGDTSHAIALRDSAAQIERQRDMSVGLTP